MLVLVLRLFRAARQIALTLHWPAADTLPRLRSQQNSVLTRSAKVGPMHRLFGLLAVVAAALGLFLLFGPDPEPRSAGGSSLGSAPVAYGGWALGLVMGLTLAWLAGVDWSTLPERLGTWFRLQRRRLWLAALGGVFAGILLLF